MLRFLLFIQLSFSIVRANDNSSGDNSSKNTIWRYWDLASSAATNIKGIATTAGLDNVKLPELSGLPGLPGLSGLPGLPTLPELSTLLTLPTLPELSTLLTLPELSTLLTLPTLAKLLTLPTLPDIPTIFSLPTLPEIPKFSDIYNNLPDIPIPNIGSNLSYLVGGIQVTYSNLKLILWYIFIIMVLSLVALIIFLLRPFFWKKDKNITIVLKKDKKN